MLEKESGDLWVESKERGSIRSVFRVVFSSEIDDELSLLSKAKGSILEVLGISLRCHHSYLFPLVYFPWVILFDEPWLRALLAVKQELLLFSMARFVLLVSFAELHSVDPTSLEAPEVLPAK